MGSKASKASKDGALVWRCQDYENGKQKGGAYMSKKDRTMKYNWTSTSTGNEFESKTECK
jgi:hypothetical protein